MIFSGNRYSPRIECGAGFFGIRRVALRRWRLPAIVTLAATAALAALSPDAAAGQVRRAAPTESTAPRNAGEPIMAIVSIKSQQVTFYDAEVWILRAPVSTGVKIGELRTRQPIRASRQANATAD
jgi:hypothetical protein